MKVSQTGVPAVSLSSYVGQAKGADEPGFIAVNVPIKIEERGDETADLSTWISLAENEHLLGRVVERRSSSHWLLYRVPRQLCPEGAVLTFSTSLADDLLWQRAFRVVWRGRFPGLEVAD